MFKLYIYIYIFFKFNPKKSEDSMMVKVCLDDKGVKGAALSSGPHKTELHIQFAGRKKQFHSNMINTGDIYKLELS